MTMPDGPTTAASQPSTWPQPPTTRDGRRTANARPLLARAFSRSRSGAVLQAALEGAGLEPKGPEARTRVRTTRGGGAAGSRVLVCEGSGEGVAAVVGEVGDDVA